MKKKIKLVESPLGMKTTERMARRLDEALRTLPKSYTYRTKSSSDSESEVGDRTDVSCITTAKMDRQKEIVLPDQIDLTEYRDNPIVLFSHNQEKPIGKCMWIKPNENGLIAKTQYASRPKKYEGEFFPDFIFSLIQQQILRGKSIGFLPLEIADPTDEQLALNPDLERVITKSLLVEFSVVGVPSNPQALVEAVSKNFSKDFFNYKVIGHIKQKKKVKAHKEMKFSSDQIADEVIKCLARRWHI